MAIGWTTDTADVDPVQATTYASDGVTYTTLESWDVGEGELLGVSAEITIGYDSGALAFGRTLYAHADARRRPGGAMAINGTSPLNDGGNAAGVLVQWLADGNTLRLQIRTTYVGNVAVLWQSRVRPGTLAT